jgi:hypothetical protein
MKNMRDKTLIYLQTMTGVHVTDSILRDKQRDLYFRKYGSQANFKMKTERENTLHQESHFLY